MASLLPDDTSSIVNNEPKLENMYGDEYVPTSVEMEQQLAIEHKINQERIMENEK